MRACLDTRTGQILRWPFPNRDYDENETILELARYVWRAYALYHKPKSIRLANGSLVSNWTPADVDLYAYLSEIAWQ